MTARKKAAKKVAAAEEEAPRVAEESTGTKSGGRKAGKTVNFGTHQVLFNDVVYGPGKMAVPADFPEFNAKEGRIVHPAGSVAERNARSAAIAGAQEVTTSSGKRGKVGTESSDEDDDTPAGEEAGEE